MCPAQWPSPFLPTASLARSLPPCAVLGRAWATCDSCAFDCGFASVASLGASENGPDVRRVGREQKSGRTLPYKPQIWGETPRHRRPLLQRRRIAGAGAGRAEHGPARSGPPTPFSATATSADDCEVSVQVRAWRCPFGTSRGRVSVELRLRCLRLLPSQRSSIELGPRTQVAAGTEDRRRGFASIGQAARQAKHTSIPSRLLALVPLSRIGGRMHLRASHVVADLSRFPTPCRANALLQPGLTRIHVVAPPSWYTIQRVRGLAGSTA